ncbi:uncharacterized protein VNE69_02196 [Vairimorpha necatrix]|uniref:Uncharacterized protein n=1 Tax=Vairimorpha necatrix TaxID=6039 RepID=A0AAX4J9N8_9MICR
MEESDVELGNVFDDNIKIKKNVLRDKTNLNKTSNNHILENKVVSNSQDILRKYNINFNIEEDQRTNELHNQYIEKILINSQEERDLQNEYNLEKRVDSTGDKINPHKLSIKNKEENDIISEIQREFRDLKETHKNMLHLRNRLLLLIEKEVENIKKEVTETKNKEILCLEEKHSKEIEEYKEKMSQLKEEVEYHKERFIRYKIFCKKKVLEYKDKITKAHNMK